MNIGTATVFQLDSTAATFREPIVAEDVTISIKDATAQTTTITQNLASNSCNFAQNYDGGAYNFSSKTITGQLKTCSFSNGQWTVDTLLCLTL